MIYRLLSRGRCIPPPAHIIAIQIPALHKGHRAARNLPPQLRSPSFPESASTYVCTPLRKGFAKTSPRVPAPLARAAQVAAGSASDGCPPLPTQRARAVCRAFHLLSPPSSDVFRVYVFDHSQAPIRMIPSSSQPRDFPPLFLPFAVKTATLPASFACVQCSDSSSVIISIHPSA